MYLLRMLDNKVFLSEQVYQKNLFSYCLECHNVKHLLNYNQNDFIYQIIESPISDEINLDQIITKIENEELIKYEKILKSLKKAKMKLYDE